MYMSYVIREKYIYVIREKQRCIYICQSVYIVSELMSEFVCLFVLCVFVYLGCANYFVNWLCTWCKNI